MTTPPDDEGAAPALPSRFAWRNLEPLFTTVLTVSFLGHALFMLTVFEIEPPPPPSVGDVAALIERLRPEAPVLPPPRPDPTTQAPDPMRKKNPETLAKASAPPTAEPQTGARASDRHEVRAQVRKLGLLGRIADGGGALADVFGTTSSVASLSTNSLGAGVRPASAGDIGRPDEEPDQTEAVDVALPTSRAGGAIGFGQGGKPRARPRAKKRAVRQSEPVSVGTPAPSLKSLAQVLRRRRGAFQSCYDAAQKMDKDLKGKLVVEFVIAATGRVEQAEVVADKMSAPTINGCVRRAFLRLRFPAQAEELTIKQSLVFQPPRGS